MTEENIEELRKEVKELREELERTKNRNLGEKRVDKTRSNKEESDISRRDFLKSALGGAAGLSAAAILPSAAGFTFKDDSSFKFGNLSSGQTNMEVGTGGDLNMHGNNINNISSLTGIQDHINIRDRGSDKTTPDNGLSLYSKNGKLHGIDAEGEREIPLGSIGTEEQSNVYYAREADGQNGGEQINNAIQKAKADSEHAAVVVTGAPDDLSDIAAAECDSGYLLTDSIYPDPSVPIHFFDSYCFLAAGSYTNIMTNPDHDTLTSGITVVGHGEVRFDGNASNQGSVADHADGSERIGVHFAKVDNFYFDNIDIGPTHGWGFGLEDCDNFRIPTISFSQDGSTANQDGLHYVGPCKGGQVGCVLGTTEDDSVSFTAQASGDLNENDSGSIVDCHIEEINTKVTGIASHLKLLGGDGYRLKNISVGTIRAHEDSTANELVHFGDAGFANSPPTTDEFTNITIDKLIRPSPNGNAALAFDSPVGSVEIGHIELGGVGDWTSMIIQPSNGYKIDSLTVHGAHLDAGPGENGGNVLKIEDTIDTLKMSDIHAVQVRRMLTGGGTINDGRYSDCVVEANSDNVINFAGTASIRISNWDVDVSNVGYGIFGTVPSGMSLGGDFPPVDVTQLDNVEGSCAYNNGVTGTAGPAYNDGAEWTSLVDNTSI